MRKLPIYIALLMMLWASSAGAQPLSQDSELAVALKTMADAKGFSATFEQVLMYADGGKRTYRGDLAVCKPGKFRWHYTQPYEQLYVSNGDGVWLYEPDLLQAQRRKDLGDVDPIVLRLLEGRVGLQDVDVLQTEHLGKAMSSWHIRVRSENHEVTVWIGVKQGVVAWLESRDVLSNRNRLNLNDLDFTPPAAAIFEFKVPEGVDVIEAM